MNVIAIRIFHFLWACIWIYFYISPNSLNPISYGNKSTANSNYDILYIALGTHFFVYMVSSIVNKVAKQYKLVTFKPRERPSLAMEGAIFYLLVNLVFSLYAIIAGFIGTTAFNYNTTYSDNMSWLVAVCSVVILLSLRKKAFWSGFLLIIYFSIILLLNTAHTPELLKSISKMDLIKITNIIGLLPSLIIILIFKYLFPSYIIYQFIKNDQMQSPKID